jgi:hypothetical protein
MISRLHLADDFGLTVTVMESELRTTAEGTALVGKNGGALSWVHAVLMMMAEAAVDSVRTLAGSR